MSGKAAAVVFFAALAVRVLTLAAFHGTPFSEILLVDARWHDVWAWDWARSGVDLGETAFFRAPFYPTWVSWIYKVFGHHLMAVRVVQSVLGAAGATVIGGAVSRLWGARYGVLAGLMAAFYGPFIYFDQELLIPSLLVALLAGVLFLAVLRPTPWTSIGAGILLGLAVVTRPNVLVLIPLLVWFFWKRSGEKSKAWRSGVIAGFVIMALVPALYVTEQNNRAEGVPVFIASQGGINFYAGNNPQASGKSVDIPEFSNMVDWREFVPRMQALAEGESGGPLNSLEVSNYWTRRGLRWIWTNPADALGLYVKKAAYLFTGYEIPNNRNLYFRTPGVLQGLLWDTPFFSFPAGLVFPLALVGFILVLGTRRFRPGGLFLLGWVILYAASLLPFFVCARFRLPLVPALLGPAAFALVHWRKLLRPRLAVVFAASLLFVNAGLFGARQASPETDLTKLGAALFEQGDMSRAVQVLEEARDASPGNVGAAFWLAHAYSRVGDVGKAIPLYQALVAARPTDAALWFQLGTSRFEAGDVAGSLEPLQKAALLNPEDFRSQVNLGAAYEENGMVPEAIACYRRGMDLEPRHPLAYLRLADLLLRSGDDKKSAEVLRQGSENLPGDYEIHFRLASAYGRLGMNSQAMNAVTVALSLKPDSREAQALRETLSKAAP